MRWRSKFYNLIHRVNLKVKRSSPQNLPKSQKCCQIRIPGFFHFSKIPYFSRLDH